MKKLRFASAMAAMGLALSLTACGSSAAAPGEANAAASTEIIMGTEGTYKPFSYHDLSTNELVGFDVEVAKAVGEKLGVTIKFQETPWDSLFAAVDAKRIDGIANAVTMTPEREAKYSFSAPYTNSPGVVVTRADDNGLGSFADLAGKKVAATRNSNWIEVADKSGAKTIAVEGWAQSVALLQQGRVDATLNDKVTVLDYMKQNSKSELRIAASSDDPARNAFMFAKGSPLTEKFDGALEELSADGTLAKISEKYFDIDVTK